MMNKMQVIRIKIIPTIRALWRFAELPTQLWILIASNHTDLFPNPTVHHHQGAAVFLGAAEMHQGIPLDTQGEDNMQDGIQNSRDGM